MSSSVAKPIAERHRELSEIRPAMAKADLRNAESIDFRAEIGACLQRAASLLGWSLKQLAAAVKRDERQVARWLNGQERVQLDVVFDCEELRQPFALQLSKLSGADWHIHVEFRKVG